MEIVWEFRSPNIRSFTCIISLKLKEYQKILIDGNIVQALFKMKLTGLRYR